MKKTSFKFLLISVVVLAGIFSPFFSSDEKVSAQNPEDEIVVETTGYSALSLNSYVFGGYYSGNVEKKGFTTYFEFKKNDPNFNANAQETIKIVRERNVKESEYFYSSPELNLFSTYYFRAVGYFNDNPSQKFYGIVLSLRTGYIPIGATTYPFTVGGNGLPHSPACIAPQVLVNNACEAPAPAPPICILPQVLDSSTNTCIDPSLPAPTVDIKAVPERIAPNGRSTITWSSTNATSCITSGDWGNSNSIGTAGNYPTGPLTSTKTYTIRCKGAGGTSSPFTVRVTIDSTLSPRPNADPNPPPAGGGTSLVKCGLRDADNKVTNPCDFDDVLILINDVIKFILVYMVIPIAAIMFAYAGFMLMTSGGSTERKSKAKSIFINVAIGLIIVVAAFLIVQTVLKIAGYKTDIGIHWFGFQD